MWGRRARALPLLENGGESLFIFDADGVEDDLIVLKGRSVLLAGMGRRLRLEGINGRLRL